MLITACLALLAGCSEEPKPAPSATPSAGTPSPSGTAGGDGKATSAPGVAPKGDPAKGRQVFLAQCVACHNPDPARDGPLGPAVKGSSPELLEARVVRGTYPPSYTPKRDSTVMPARPDLAASIPDLAAYLR